MSTVPVSYTHLDVYERQVVVKDVKGKVRDVDEYNRRYTSRDNNFSMENDTCLLYTSRCV